MPQPVNARRIRPSMPDYGITAEETEGMLTWDWVDEQMRKSRNYWVCTTRPDGRPHAAPVWGVWLDNTLYFSSGTTSVKAKNLTKNPQLVVHLESGDDTLIIEGTVVALDFNDDRKTTIFKDYGEKYSFNPADGDDAEKSVWYELIPTKIMTWLESEFLESVAYWLFDA
jgi:hypothetical protein